MRVEDILRKQLGDHCGYQLSNISVSKLSYHDILDGGFMWLRRVPGKVTAFLDRRKIDKAFKSVCFRGHDNFYLVVAKDGTIFHLEY